MFADVHPSPSAGDGRGIEQAKYHYPTDRPEEPIHCAMCGFCMDLDVTPYGDTLLSPGIQYGAPVTKTVNLPVPAGAAPISFQDTTVEPTVVGGCPMCGTFNPKGFLVGEDFGVNTNITNL